MKEKAHRSMTVRGHPSLSIEETTRLRTRETTKSAFTRGSVHETDDDKPEKRKSWFKSRSKKPKEDDVVRQGSGSFNGNPSEFHNDYNAGRREDGGYRSASPTSQTQERPWSPSNIESSTEMTGRTLSRCFAERIWPKEHCDVIYVEYIP